MLKLVFRSKGVKVKHGLLIWDGGSMIMLIIWNLLQSNAIEDKIDLLQFCLTNTGNF